MDKLHLGWMYPDLLNLHGERGSVQALVRAGENLGLQVEVHRIRDFDDEIPFAELDLLVFLPGEIKTFYKLKPALESQREALEQYLDKGGYAIAIGTTGLLFGKEIQRENGEVFQGLGLLDLTAKERQYVWGDDLHFRLNDTKQEIVGPQIQMADVDAKEPLGKTIYGHGNNNTGAEGARYKNLIYTNCLGPLFVKNPWWAEDILKNICLQKFLGLGQKTPNTLASNSFDSTLRFIETKPKFDK
jgi:hypothetical protein